MNRHEGGEPKQRSNMIWFKIWDDCSGSWRESGSRDMGGRLRHLVIQVWNDSDLDYSGGHTLPLTSPECVAKVPEHCGRAADTSLLLLSSGRVCGEHRGVWPDVPRIQTYFPSILGSAGLLEGWRLRLSPSLGAAYIHWSKWRHTAVWVLLLRAAVKDCGLQRSPRGGWGRDCRRAQLSSSLSLILLPFFGFVLRASLINLPYVNLCLRVCFMGNLA